jgi:hypothetical protein
VKSNAKMIACSKFVRFFASTQNDS